MKRKMLIYGDSPEAHSGLGRLHRYLISHFSKSFDITLIGINHQHVEISPLGIKAIYDHDKYPIDIVPVYFQDNTNGYEITKKVLKEQDFDVIFTSHDSSSVMNILEGILQARLRTGAKWVHYTPIDRKNVIGEEKKFFSLPDKLVFLSRYAKSKVYSATGIDAEYIYHPLRLEDFPELSKTKVKEYRSKLFSKFSEDAYIIGNFNRNIFRKDLARTIYVFKKFQNEVPNAKLYLHTRMQDLAGDLMATIKELKINEDDIMFGTMITPTMGVTQEQLNILYRCMDMVISTSTGEGFGYSTVEAMACRVPVVMPKNTSFTELVKDRGELVDCDDFVVSYGNSNVMREVVNAEKMVKAMIRTHNKKNKEQIEDAQTFVMTELDPQTIYKKWDKLFNEL